jgi:hypothetical protein
LRRGGHRPSTGRSAAAHRKNKIWGSAGQESVNDNRHDDIGCNSIHFNNILLLLSPSISVVYCGDDISFFFVYIVVSIIVAAFE